MSSMQSFSDQENRPLGGGPLGGRRGKAASEVEPARPRAVLGEISLNPRRQPLRANGKPQQGSFSIFCDDPAKGPVPVRSQRTAPSQDSSFDKENVPVRGACKVPQQTRVGQLKEECRPTKTIQTIQDIEPMNTSVILEDSPMVVESEDVSKEQWRVPPIKDNQTVDIFAEPEYFQDIYRYLKESEVRHLPKWNYMAKQNDITYSMRSILVDWLVEVGEEYKLQTETLHLAVNYIDRFLSYMAVQRAKLQLVGAACMFIAAKYEEIYPPDVSEFVYITDDTYSKRQVLRMEHLVLRVLDFELSVPTPLVFLNKMVLMEPEVEEKEKLSALSAYLAELSLVEGESFLRFSPSLVAAASVALARHSLNLEAWTSNLQENTGYSLDDMKECFVNLHVCWSKAENNAQQAVREKYKAAKLFAVSDTPVPKIF